MRYVVFALAVWFCFSKPSVVLRQFDRFPDAVSVTLCSDIHCLSNWTAEKKVAGMHDMRVWISQLDAIYRPLYFWIE